VLQFRSCETLKWSRIAIDLFCLPAFEAGRTFTFAFLAVGSSSSALSLSLGLKGKGAGPEAVPVLITELLTGMPKIAIE
jgi:hypothetical protein